MHLTENQLARLVDGELGSGLRTEALVHLDQCGECRREVMAIARLRQEAPTRRRQRRRILWGVAGLGAVAAALTLAVVLRQPAPGDEAATVRSRPVTENIATIEAVTPADGAVIVPEMRLVWRGKGADSYRVVVLSSEGRPLWTTDTPDTSVLLPPEIPLSSGTTYFWRVDALTEGVTASTGPRQFQVQPR